jgi:hypothetical protein
MAHVNWFQKHPNQYNFKVWGKALEFVSKAQIIPIQRIMKRCAYCQYEGQFVRSKETATVVVPVSSRSAF